MTDDRDTSASQETFDAVIVGGGVCGIYMLYKLLGLGLNAIVLDRAAGPGGTWYWNRYPGARFDSESYTYGYSFSEELLQEWNWSERFAAQPETLEYLNYVVDKFKLRAHMRFNAGVSSARFQSDDNQWLITLEDGSTVLTTYFCTAVGMLSAATPPRLPGVDQFRGQSFHTYYWPQKPVELTGKRVAVVGTGATGVQVIGAIAAQVESLTVFQRRPNWCAPLHNGPISQQEMAEIKASYEEIFAQCRSTPNGFLHGPDRRELAEVPEDERREYWEKLYNSPGFGVWLGNFRDVLIDPDANAAFSAFIAEKIRERVADPETADKLIPKDHGFGTRRVPLETRYYEAYNLPHVRLVDINETPIEGIDETGIQTAHEHHEFDIIIYATGFDAITGAFDRIDIQGEGGIKLRDKWHDGPVTYLGVQVAGFPNMFTLAGPQGASVSTNFPPAIETAVEWAADLIEYLNSHNKARIEPEARAEQAWLEHVKSYYDMSLLSNTKSWFTGYNSNVDGHDRLRYMIYLGGAPSYREKLQDVAASGYAGFKIS